MSDLLFPETGVAAAPSAARTWRDVLIAAADRLETIGWIQSGYADRIGDDFESIGPTCAVGAINAAAGYAPSHMHYGIGGTPIQMAFTKLTEFLGGLSITGWNDTVPSNAATVIKAMRDTARAP